MEQAGFEASWVVGSFGTSLLAEDDKKHSLAFFR
jgi:hypothetical protein